MPEYLKPGVYIEEQDSGPVPIEGVSTSETAFVGVTERGPADTLPPVLVTSFPEYQRTFGGYFAPATTVSAVYNNFLPHAVAGFFNNGGKRLYIKRLKPAGMAAGTLAGAALQNSAGAPQVVTRLRNSAATGATQLTLVSLRGIQEGTTLTLTQVKNGVTTTEAVTVKTFDDGAGTADLTAPTTAGYEAAYTTVALTGSALYTPTDSSANFQLAAKNEGAWGNRIRLRITPSSLAQSQVAGLAESVGGSGNFDLVTLNSVARWYVGALVEFSAKTGAGMRKSYARVTAITGTALQVDPPFTAAGDLPVPGSVARSCEFDLTAAYDTTSETFRYLTLSDATPYYYRAVIANRGSSLLAVPAAAVADNASKTPAALPVPLDGLNVALTGGDDQAAALTVADIIGNDLGPGNRTGIAALVDALNVSIIAAPGITDQAAQQALIDQCENLKYRFAILDPDATPAGSASPLDPVINLRNRYDTRYAALYYPRLVVYDPLTDAPLTVPPSGHMAGIYAKTDVTRGVWKAPANVTINGIEDLEVKLTDGDHEEINPEPKNICALRDFRERGRGLRVYGARCITSDAAWKYINVRRLFIFLEASLDQGTQWAVFEPNDQRLWDRLKQSISAFLTGVWREGGLMGEKAEDAFYVLCGEETMTLDDRENGRLILKVGVKPVFPAEFVIIRIGQWAGGSSVEEL